MYKYIMFLFTFILLCANVFAQRAQIIENGKMTTPLNANSNSIVGVCIIVFTNGFSFDGVLPNIGEAIGTHNLSEEAHPFLKDKYDTVNQSLTMQGSTNLAVSGGLLSRVSESNGLPNATITFTVLADPSTIPLRTPSGGLLLPEVVIATNEAVPLGQVQDMIGYAYREGTNYTAQITKQVKTNLENSIVLCYDNTSNLVRQASVDGSNNVNTVKGQLQTEISTAETNANKYTDAALSGISSSRIYNATNANEWTEIRGNERWLYSVHIDPFYNFVTADGTTTNFSVMPFPIPALGGTWATGNLSLSVMVGYDNDQFSYIELSFTYNGDSGWGEISSTNNLNISCRNWENQLVGNLVSRGVYTNIVKSTILSNDDITSHDTNNAAHPDIRASLSGKADKSTTVTVNGQVGNLSTGNVFTVVQPPSYSIISDLVVSTNVIRVVSTQSVYVATVSSPCMITQDVSNLHLSTNQTAQWKTKINIVDWSAVTNVSFAPNIAVQCGEFTVPGCYEFDSSLLCNGTIEMRQTYPVIPDKCNVMFSARNASSTAPPLFQVSNAMLSSASNHWVKMYSPIDCYSYPTILTLQYTSSTVGIESNPITISVGYGTVTTTIVREEVVLRDEIAGPFTGARVNVYIPTMSGRPDYFNVETYIHFNSPTSGLSLTLMGGKIRRATEYEIREFNNGKRDW